MFAPCAVSIVFTGISIIDAVAGLSTPETIDKNVGKNDVVQHFVVFKLQLIPITLRGYVIFAAFTVLVFTLTRHFLYL
jgi:hypothetical protein